jgi:hypothetical protein
VLEERVVVEVIKHKMRKYTEKEIHVFQDCIVWYVCVCRRKEVEEVG